MVGVIGPGGRKAVEIVRDLGTEARIGVIATEATVASNAYIDAIRRASVEPKVIQAACPLFVPLAEENWIDQPETSSIAEKYLAEIKAFAPQALVLGCTHYPILREVIQRTVGADVKLIDSGEATADEVAIILAKEGLANAEGPSEKRELCDSLDHFYVTDAAERFGRVAERFLGARPQKLEAIEIYGVDELGRKHG
ncbi:MAG: glutamate racemase [Acidobacteria bacterium OLB17]|nr:MAG: glutamate racemase [Acidobacteria bacterium OLB17]